MKDKRNWYGQWYTNGKHIRVSLKTDLKEAAKRELRRRMANSEPGVPPENITRKLRYGNLRQALLDDESTEATNPCRHWPTAKKQSGVHARG
jgi:hypothetical protein